MAVTKVSTKGGVIIPKEIRRKCGINPGMMVNIKEINGIIQIIPTPEDPIKTARGFLKKGRKKSLTQILLEEREQDKRKEEAV